MSRASQQLILSIFLFFSVQATLSAQFTGKIFVDENENGIYDKGESLLKEAVVSDGLNIVRSGTDGMYKLSGWERARFITIYPGADFSTLVRFHRIQEDQTEYDFPVLLKDKKEAITFLHISDTETYEAKEWYNDLRSYIDHHQPDFLVHTGDICYRAGLDWHAKYAASEDLGVPTYYCLGNHDLIEGAYGEQYFEEKFGPAWYAFEEGNTLFVITPMMSGDYKPGFTREEIGGWMRNLVATYPREQPKYFFNHDLLAQSEHFSFRFSETDSVYLNDYNLKAWVYGHWHNNTYMKHGESGIQSYCVSPAAKGGIDHSPSSIRVFEVDKEGFKLKWAQNTGGNLFMGSPLVEEGRIITSVFDDGDAENAYMICLDEQTGQVLWKYATKNSIKNQMVLADGKVVGTDVQGYTYAVDVEKGTLEWEVDLGYHRLGGFVSGIATDGKYIYTGFGKSLMALDAKNGRIKWRNNAWQGGEGSTPTMVIADDLLIASSNWRALYAHDKETGALIWSRKDAGLRFRDGTVAHFDKHLWVAQDSSGVGLLRALDARSGKTIKSFPTGISNRSTSAPVLTHEKILVAGSHPGIIAIDAAGKVLWKTEVEPSMFYTPQYYSDRQQTIESTPLVIGHSIIFGAMDGYLYRLDQETGYIEQKIYLGAPILSSASKTKEGFVVADFAGNVYQFEYR